MKSAVRALVLAAAALLLPACESNDPLGPTPVDQGIVVFMHSGFRGSSQQIGADVTDLDKVEGPCGQTEDEATRTWNDCISSVRVLPGWRATLYGDRNFHGGTVQITEDVADLKALAGSCSGSFDDCISSIRVSRR